jgi:hypothetical protein
MTNTISKNSIIQIMPSHKWGGCLAVVDEVKSFGCQAYVSMPDAQGVGRAYIRLNHEEYEPVGAMVIFVPEGEDDDDHEVK